MKNVNGIVRKGPEVHFKHLAQKGQIPCASLSHPSETREGEVVVRYGHKVRSYGNGMYATMDGRPIIDNAKSRMAGWVNSLARTGR